MATVFDGVPALSNMDVTPGINAYVQGTGLRQREDALKSDRDTKIAEIVTKGALSADTPEKWGQFVGVLQKRFPDVDLSPFSDFNVRQPMLDQARDPYKDAALDIDRQRLALDKSKAATAAAKDTGGGPYAGTGLDAQNWNIILKGDPSAPEYAAAYSQLFETPRLVQGGDKDGQAITVPVYQRPPATVRAPAGYAPQPGAPAPSLSGEGSGPAAAPAGQPQLSAVPGSPGVSVGQPVVTGPAKMTDTQAITATYADRMANSGAVIDQMGKYGLDWKEYAKLEVPPWVFGGGNALISPEFRQLIQAQRDFVNATLRRESGAVISPSEFENAQKQYFPQPGDDDKTLAQKELARKTVVAGFQRAAGPAYKAPAKAPVQIKDDADYNRLPVGAQFIDPEGNLREKR